MVDPLLASCLEPLLRKPEAALNARERSEYAAKVPRLKRCLSAHARAFDAGSVSLNRLIDVLVLPFLQLAEMVNLYPPSSQEMQPGAVADTILDLRSARLDMMIDWGQLLREGAYAAITKDDGMPRFVLQMSNSRRADFVKGMFKAGIFKVRTTMLCGMFVVHSS